MFNVKKGLLIFANAIVLTYIYIYILCPTKPLV